MEISPLVTLGCALAPAACLAVFATVLHLNPNITQQPARLFQRTSLAALALAALSLALHLTPVTQAAPWPGVVLVTPLGLVLAVLVQWLGSVIGAFSARYLAGEARLAPAFGALAGVLASAHLLLLADHWLLLILAWTAIGRALQPLLCFYPDRPFARLAAHKKWLADRAADLLLVAAAALAWREAGSGALSDLWQYIAIHGLSMPLQACAVALVVATGLRTAVLPVHGWLIQVMEAPTPVSALLHAGVVNLGGFVLIRCAPLLEAALPARALLLLLGLATAVLAGMVTLTRVSIKVRLAWSTVAQMGFMLMECALGLYTLAAAHLLGHAVYKAHAFLAASDVVRETRLQRMHGDATPTPTSCVLAPVLTTAAVVLVAPLGGAPAWPGWWSLILGLAWAPLCWWPARRIEGSRASLRVVCGLGAAIGLTLVARLAHALPMHVQDAPHTGLGLIALAGMAVLYGWQVLLHAQPSCLAGWRRWSYAGFYLDEAVTRLALHLWPGRLA